jgi:anti-sigma regulatory factor (Ser/Thr protein kinase)
MGFHVDHGQAQIFGMMLHEALTNAVEHGLLGLDSAIKSQGFEAYEQHRKLALARPEAGSVRFRITLLHVADDPSHAIRRIQAEVEDPGPGFDWRTWLEPRDPGLHPFGRGIDLLRGLGTELAFNEAGNRVGFAVECP